MSTKDLVQLSFAKIAFPYEEITIDGAMRNHVHKFPHSAGGIPDKLGRDLYQVGIQTKFVGDSLLPQYKDLWPSNLTKLVKIFDEGRTDDLVIPSLGIPIKFFCTNWTRTLRSSFTNGEAVSLKFLEDEESLYLAEKAAAVKAIGMGNALAALNDEVEKKGLLKTISEGIDKILSTASDVMAMKDQFELYSNLLAAKLMALISMCREFVDTAQSVKKLENLALLDAIHALLAQAISLYKDQKQMGIETRVFTVTSEMTLSQLSFRIFGTATRGQDLMAMNSIPDPFSIKPGARVRYYPD